jgi:predicted O-methyltransferase YrrM
MAVTAGVSSATAFSDIECASLYHRCMGVLQGGIVVEIGCQLGRSSSIIAQVGKERGYHSIHIDPYTYQLEYLSGWISMMHRIGGIWTHLCMRTDQAEWHIRQLALDNIDLALIDGDHEARGVRIDCRVVGNNIKSGGVLLAHDYGHPHLPGVKQGMDEYIDYQWTPLVTVGTLGAWSRNEN